MGKEIWKPVVGYEGLYDVSSLGRVRSLGRVIVQKNGKRIKIRERILKPAIQNRGYEFVSLSNSLGLKLKLVHQLVGKAFIPNPDNKPFIDHINGNRRDNRVENLRWCTPKENNNFELARKHASDGLLGKTGRLCPNSKKVNQYTLDGTFIRSYYGTCEASRETGIRNISRACLSPTRTAGGYIWKYDNIK